MTAQQLHHLAELASEADQYFRATDPAQARAFAEAAKMATLMAERTERAEHTREMRATLQEIKVLAGG